MEGSDAVFSGVIAASKKGTFDPLARGLVAYYPFNGNANDESGFGNNASINTTALAVDRFGKVNSAYAFDGVSALIMVPDSPSLRVTNDITVTCWVSFSGTNLEVRLVGKGGDSCRNYGLWYDPTSTAWLFQQFPPSCGGGCQENTANLGPSAGLAKWYHMVGIRSGTVSRLYLNGQLLQQRSPVCSDNVYTGPEPLYMGAPDPTNDARFSLMQGSLDDIRIYNRALSDSEVQTLYRRESRH